jgi:hypothetical protein
MNGQVTTRSFLEILRSGEWLPDDHNIEEEAEEIEKLMKEKEEQKQEMMPMNGPPASGSNQPTPNSNPQRPGNSPGASR